MADRCVLCRRKKSSTEYCPYHSLALEYLKSSYKRWKDALGTSWVDFLLGVSEKPETGVWSREVALYESEKGQSK
jgi:hypothetical protein